MESLFEQTDIIRQKGRRWRKIRNISFLVLFSGLIVWLGIQYYYPCSKGVVTGKLTFLAPIGLIYKTYEGKLIQTDNQSPEDDEIQLNEFKFSITKKRIAAQLAQSGGKTVALHYTEYFKSLPWRGYSHFVVNEIVSISENKEIKGVEIIADGANVKNADLIVNK